MVHGNFIIRSPRVKIADSVLQVENILSHAGKSTFQLYEGLPVLSAQPGASLQQKAEHHLYGSLPLKTNCDAAYFLRILEPVCRRIQDSGRRPILVGGSGLYIKSFTHGFDPVPPADPMLRKELTGLSLETLKDRLQTADPEAANQIDMQNPRRVIRALEICLTTGLPLSHFRSRWNSEARPHLALLLFREREELHARIECNIDRQFQSGVDKEVADALVNRIGPGARKAIGFESIEKFLKGRISMDECRKSMLLNTRQYAKRQLTWFRGRGTFPAENLSLVTADQTDFIARRLGLS